MKYPATFLILASLIVIMCAGVTLKRSTFHQNLPIPHYYEAYCFYPSNEQGTMGSDGKILIRLNCQNKNVNGARSIPQDFSEIQGSNYIIAHPGTPVDCLIVELDYKTTATCSDRPSTPSPPQAALNRAAFFIFLKVWSDLGSYS